MDEQSKKHKKSNAKRNSTKIKKDNKILLYTLILNVYLLCIKIIIFIKKNTQKTFLTSGMCCGFLNKPKTKLEKKRI